MADISVLNTTAQLTSQTLATLEGSWTITGTWTFDNDPSAPFAVSSGSAVVSNLDADKLDGAEGTAYAKLADNETVTGNWTFGGAFSINSVLSESVTSQKDDWAPTGIANANVIRISGSGTQSITGLSAGSSGAIHLIVNADGGAIFILENEDTQSTETNRFAGPNGADVSLNPGDCVLIWYDPSSERWRPITF